MRYLVFGVLLLIAGGASFAWLQASGTHGSQETELVDAATGRPISNGWLCLLRAGVVVESNVSAPTAWAAGKVLPGDELLAAASGYDLGRVVVSRDWVAKISLQTARQHAELSVSGRVAGPGVLIGVRHLLRRDGVYDSLLYFDETYDLMDRPASVPLPQGLYHMTFLPKPSAQEIIVPTTILLHDGDKQEFRLEKPRTIVVHQPATPSGQQVLGLALIDPRVASAMPAEDIDAYRSSWTAGYSVTAPHSADSFFINAAPPIQLLLLAKVGARWMVQVLNATTIRVELSDLGLKAMESAVIRIGGVPAPEGTLLLPGQVPEGAFNAALTNAAVLSRLLVRTEANASVALDWWKTTAVTAWHPEHGLAVLHETEEGVLSGAWESGSVTIEVGPGAQAQGTVSTRSGWVGSDLVGFGEVPDSVRRTVSGREKFLLTGVTLGRLLLTFDLQLTDASGRMTHLTGSLHVHLTSNSPSAVLRVVDGVIQLQEPE